MVTNATWPCCCTRSTEPVNRYAEALAGSGHAAA
ncbi:MAG: hypothetical protein QOH80_128, partial [Actinomycetota bacterium]|nr:hypothetical protein [Actinomycetota bacterium]